MALDVPPGWSPDDGSAGLAERLPPPDLSQSPQVQLEGWRVDFGPPRGSSEGGAIVSACFVGHADGWLPEADEVALQKLEGMVVSTYLRLGVGGGFDTFGPVVRENPVREGPVRSRALQGAPASARTWLAFEADGTVHGCFVECVRPDATCRTAVDGARLEGVFVEPPGPTAWMRAVAYAVHHPATGAATVVVLAVFLGLLAVLTRRRPRQRP